MSERISRQTKDITVKCSRGGKKLPNSCNAPFCAPDLSITSYFLCQAMMVTPLKFHFSICQSCLLICCFYVLLKVSGTSQLPLKTSNPFPKASLEVPWRHYRTRYTIPPLFPPTPDLRRISKNPSPLSCGCQFLRKYIPISI